MEKLKPIPALAAVFSLVLSLVFSPPSHAQCQGFEYCELVWSDEFEGTELDTFSKWSVQLGDGTDEGLPSGWGNAELQWYTDQNATVADGFLTITARKETVEPGFPYTSARLRTKYRAEWTYGRMEMRAKMPLGKGLWPAFWMLPSDTSYGGWAASGEIDIMEYLGSEPDTVFGTIHYGGEWPRNTWSSSEYKLPTGTFNEDFHVFAIEWEEGEIRWYVDDVHYGTKTSWSSEAGPFPAPFDVDFHLLLNLAVGGNLPGSPDGSTQFPADYVIDYVRVYKETDGPSFSINSGHSGAWYNPETPGQGQLIDVEPASQFMFLAWFAFTDAASPNPNQQHWFTAQGNYEGNSANLVVYETLGGKFDDPQEVSTNPVGSAFVEFDECGLGRMDYVIDTWELEGSFPMRRAIPGSENVCLELSDSAVAAKAERDGGGDENTEALDQNDGWDGAWYDPAAPGQGILIDTHPNPDGEDFIFMAWFTYGDDMASGQHWYTAQGNFEGNSADIVLYETRGGSFDDSNVTATEPVGTMSIDFTDCENAVVTYVLTDDGAEGVIDVTRAVPGTSALCQELSDPGLD